MSIDQVPVQQGVQFSQEQATAWALFSGDYNPIHFDKQAAINIGQSACVVHGMLPLIYLKTDLTQKILSDNTNSEQISRSLFVRLKCFFKKPLHYNNPVQAVFTKVTGDTPSLKYALYSNNKETLNFRGSCSPVYEYPRLAIYQRHLQLVPEDLKESLQYYSECIKIHRYLWVFLEAFAFSQFIKRGLFLLFDDDWNNFSDGHPFRGLSGMSVVQMHQTTWVDRGLFACLDTSLSQFTNDYNELSLRFYRQDITEDQSQQTGEVQVGFFSGSKPLVLMNIGLLVKAH